MFNTLMGMFSEPLFWQMVVAVMVGYIFVKALPYVLSAAAIAVVYVLAVLTFMIGVLSGMAVAAWNAVVGKGDSE